ncbi:MAG: hypothetical protein ACRCZI_08435 [Cetobacterium sp.]
MSYLLDVKKNLGSFVIPTGSNNQITVFKDLLVNPTGTFDSYFSVLNTGDVIIGDNSELTYNNLVINAGLNLGFKQIIDAGTNYLMTDNDYSVEIISNTYNTITLPLASGIGGRTYIISRGSTNDNLVVQTQGGDLIDGRNIIQLKRINDHIQIQSNGINDWYMI